MVQIHQLLDISSVNRLGRAERSTYNPLPLALHTPDRSLYSALSTLGGVPPRSLPCQFVCLSLDFRGIQSNSVEDGIASCPRDGVEPGHILQTRDKEERGTVCVGTE